MSASIMEIGRLTNGTRLPVSAYEEPYGSLDNSITVPFTALWAEARDGVANLVHFSFPNTVTVELRHLAPVTPDTEVSKLEYLYYNIL